MAVSEVDYLNRFKPSVNVSSMPRQTINSTTMVLPLPDGVDFNKLISILVGASSGGIAAFIWYDENGDMQKRMVNDRTDIYDVVSIDANGVTMSCASAYIGTGHNIGLDVVISL